MSVLLSHRSGATTERVDPVHMHNARAMPGDKELAFIRLQAATSGTRAGSGAVDIQLPMSLPQQEFPPEERWDGPISISDAASSSPRILPLSARLAAHRENLRDTWFYDFPPDESQQPESTGSGILLDGHSSPVHLSPGKSAPSTPGKSAPSSATRQQLQLSDKDGATTSGHAACYVLM